MMQEMKIGLLHNTLNSMGGAERFTLDLISILHERKMSVNLATFDKTRWDIVKQRFGGVQYPDNEFSLVPFRVGIFGIYQRILMKYLANKLRNLSDIVINTHSDHLFCYSDITYMHGVTPLSPEDGELSRYESSLLLKLYFKPYKFLLKTYLRPPNEDTVFVANSEYTKARMKTLLKIPSAEVIHPPIDTETYNRLLDDSGRDDLVVTISRFTMEKNLLAIPYIAKLCPEDIKFAVITTSSGVSSGLMEKFDSACKHHDVESRIKIYRDIDFKKKLDILRRAKVYLHLMKGEHFGMSIVEACAGGCLPVVPEAGGQVEVVQGIEDSTYTEPEEASQLIVNHVKSWTLGKAKDVAKAMERFSKKEFSGKFCDLIEKVYETKKR